MMKATDLRNKTIDELNTLKGELLKEQFNLRMQRGTDQMAKNHLFKVVRHNIARVHTIMTEKQKQDQ